MTKNDEEEEKRMAGISPCLICSVNFDTEYKPKELFKHLMEMHTKEQLADYVQEDMSYGWMD